VIVSPAFHQWHHTRQAESRDKNFAGLLSFWDVLFGTYYFPAGRLPEDFGIDDASFPGHLVGQLAYPFRRTKQTEASESQPCPVNHAQQAGEDSDTRSPGQAPLQG
jgi:sterol desaturase/sphingolipid hydroxylase (fatty acid hydroxylase superfamily)